MPTQLFSFGLDKRTPPLAFYERHRRQLIEDFLRRDLLEEPNHSSTSELLTYLQDRARNGQPGRVP